MPSPDIILEPINNDNNGGYQFTIACSDITKLQLIRSGIHNHLLKRGHNIVDHRRKL